MTDAGGGAVGACIPRILLLLLHFPSPPYPLSPARHVYTLVTRTLDIPWVMVGAAPGAGAIYSNRVVTLARARGVRAVIGRMWPQPVSGFAANWLLARLRRSGNATRLCRVCQRERRLMRQDGGMMGLLVKSVAIARERKLKKEK